MSETEKIDIMISLLIAHYEKVQQENTLSNYLESLIGFLKAKDSILQKVAVSNASLFFDNLLYELSDYITSRQAVGALIAAFDKVGYPEAFDAANIILKFEENLLEMSSDEKNKVYKDRWDTGNAYRG